MDSESESEWLVGVLKKSAAAASAACKKTATEPAPIQLAQAPIPKTVISQELASGPAALAAIQLAPATVQTNKAGQKRKHSVPQPRYILPEVVFKLSPAKLAGAVLEHAVDVIQQLLSVGPTVFKIGLTKDPVHRWKGKVWSYKFDADRYQQMIVVMEVQTSDAAGFAEAALINVFRGTCGCRNDASGGEGLPAKPLVVPYFIYVVYRHLETPVS